MLSTAWHFRIEEGTSIRRVEILGLFYMSSVRVIPNLKENGWYSEIVASIDLNIFITYGNNCFPST